MLDSEQLRELLAVVPELRGLPRDLADRLTTQARSARAPSSGTLFEEGADCSGVLVLTRGELRVAKLSTEGRELGLFHLRSGDLCMMSNSCLIEKGICPAQGLAVGEAAGVLIPQSLFLALLERIPTFQSTVLRNLGTRASQLMQIVEEIAFRRLDQRLASLLLREVKPTPAATIGLTHQTLAERLGTSREIVSRILKSFELRGLLQLERGRIRLLEPESLREIALPPNASS